jgi:hypothetical protein
MKKTTAPRMYHIIESLKGGQEPPIPQPRLLNGQRGGVIYKGGKNLFIRGVPAILETLPPKCYYRIIQPRTSENLLSICIGEGTGIGNYIKTGVTELEDLAERTGLGRSFKDRIDIDSGNQSELLPSPCNLPFSHCTGFIFNGHSSFIPFLAPFSGLHFYW